MKPIFLAFVITWAWSSIAYLQPANDVCDQAFLLEDVSDWCSKAHQFSNEEATKSGSDKNPCFANTGRDVWFKFTAIATHLDVSVNGEQDYGTIQKPQLVIFSGSCEGEIKLIDCKQAQEGGNTALSHSSSIVPGEDYFILVQGEQNSTGDFRLCIDNYYPKKEKVSTYTHPGKRVYIPELKEPLSKGQILQLTNLHFLPDSYSISYKAKPILRELYYYLKDHPEVVIEIGGHTNNRCDDTFCDKLSMNRAKSVASYLYRKGIPNTQVAYLGYGKTKPISGTNQSLNQRVEIKVLDFNANSLSKADAK